jgi:large subunit ribosomal protein LP2
MKYISAYLLALAGGDANPSKAKVTSILESVGITVDHDAVDALLGKLAGKNITELIEAGAAQFAAIGGGGGGAAATSSSGAPAEAAPVKEEKKEEEAVVELAGGFDDLFG